MVFIFSHCLCVDMFSVLCWIHSSAQVILFDHFLHFAQYQTRWCFTASAASNCCWMSVEWGKVKRSTPAISLHQSRQRLFHITRSHFYSHTSQPMSSHLRSPACKLHCSVSPNDAYQQWCVFSSSWHSKYKWGIIYNGFKPKAMHLW